MYNKENHWQNEKIAYWMGEKNFQWYDWQDICMQNIQTVHTDV